MADPQGRPMLWTASEIVAATDGRLQGPAFAASGVGIDSRALERGDLFVALKAGRDGHAFLDGAFAAGAAGALVERPPGEGACVVVPDTLEALGRLGAFARERASGAARAAVTGSVGKTSVTQAVLAGLKRGGDAHGSVQSFNNHIGVPLTLARMPAQTRRAVFEIGMNHAGEISPLTRLVRPHVAAVTTVEAVHVENFADGEAGVARAKAEIFEGLEPGGVAVLNADNRWFEVLSAAARAAGAAILAFGAAPGAHARLTGFAPDAEGAWVEAVIAGAPLRYRLSQTAPHWGPMSLCALTVMESLGLARDLALDALASFAPLSGRGAESRIALAAGGEATLIDESYNASPVSTTAALEALARRSAPGRRIAVLTDMLELGADSPDRHAQLARVAESVGIDKVFCAGPLMKHLHDALTPARRGDWAPTAEALAPRVAEALVSGDLVMVKGSKGSRAWLIAQSLAALGDHTAPGPGEG